jgi:hypothetical protein
MPSASVTAVGVSQEGTRVTGRNGLPKMQRMCRTLIAPFSPADAAPIELPEQQHVR